MIASNSSVPATKAFCVGQAKSGTASLYGLLAAHHRADHEPERAQILERILQESRGDLAEDAFPAYLLERDRRLNIEYDIAWANQFIIDHLLVTFPDAKFIVLIRDSYTWLQSIVGHLISREIPLEVRPFLDWWFKPDRYPHTHHDAALEAHGVFSIAAFLNAWNQHVSLCTQIIPPDRCLILRTHELSRSHQRLADFLQISRDRLDGNKGHGNRSTWSGTLDALVERAYLEEMVAAICGENMARHFPEVAKLEDVQTLWKSVVPNDSTATDLAR